MERTLIIIKPDAVLRNLPARIISRFEEKGFAIVGIRKTWLSLESAEAFYAVHKGRPFFDSLCRYMISAPSIPVVLEGENAVKRVREIMGATDPVEAAPGTIRKDFAESKERNSIHGSDSPESASSEIPFFFAGSDLVDSN